jgi:hypothetical protein
MKTRLIKNGRQWSLYGAVLMGMVYWTLALHSQPAYAATCQPPTCTTIDKPAATFVCTQQGSTLVQFVCPATLPADDTFFFKCANGFEETLPCID